MVQLIKPVSSDSYALVPKPSVKKQQAYKPTLSSGKADEGQIFAPFQVAIIFKDLLKLTANTIYNLIFGVFKPQPLIPHNNEKIRSQIDAFAEKTSNDLRPILMNMARLKDTQRSYQLTFSSMGIEHTAQVVVQKGHDTHHAINEYFKKWITELKNNDTHLLKDDQSITISFKVTTDIYSDPIKNKKNTPSTYTKSTVEMVFEKTITQNTDVQSATEATETSTLTTYEISNQQEGSFINLAAF